MRRIVIAAMLTLLILIWGSDFYLVGEPVRFDWKVFVIIVTLSGLACYKLVDYLAQEGLSVVVRGVRGVADAEEEASYAYANRLLAPFVEFVWLPADPKFCFVSSSAVRESFSYGREIPGYVSEETARALRVKFPAKNLPSCSKDPEKN